MFLAGAFADVFVWELGKKMRTHPFMGGSARGPAGPEAGVLSIIE